MKKPFTIFIIAILSLFAFFMLSFYIFRGKLDAFSKVSGNSANIQLNANWLKQPITIIVKDPNGIKLEPAPDRRFGSLTVGKLTNIDLGPLDQHFTYTYKDKKVGIFYNQATLDGKTVNIEQPMEITIPQLQKK